MKKGRRITTNKPVLGIVGLSAPDAFWHPDLYRKGKSELEKKGIQIVEGGTVHTHRFYMAEDLKLIADDFHKMLLRKDINAIMCAGGGTCINKILPFLDFDLMKENWKPFIGISNIVALMVAMLQNGMVSFHGPFSIWSYGLPGTPTEYTHNNWVNILKGYTGKLPAASEWRVYREGQAEGQLIGGNIWTMGTVAGTKYCPPDLFDGKILILEDIGKTYDRLDATLTHMKLLGAFENLHGVIVGKLNDCKPPEKVQMSVEDFLGEVFGGYDFPIIYDCDFGHVPDNLCLPIGCELKMVADKKQPELILLEPGVE